MKSIHKFIIQLHVLQCLFVRGSNKKQKRGRIISNFLKEETFCLLWQPIALRIVSMWPFFLHPQGKLTDLLLNWQGVPYSHRQRRNMMIIPFIIVHTTNTCKRWFRGQNYACPLQKRLPSPFCLARNRIYSGTHLTEELTDLLWKLPGYDIFYSPTQAEYTEDTKHFANG